MSRSGLSQLSYDAGMQDKVQPASRMLADQLRSDLAKGRWTAGEKIPSERQLAGEHRIARNTAREAIRLLTQEGRLEPRHGSGVYVTSLQPTTEEHDDFFEEFDAHGWDTPPLIELRNLTDTRLTSRGETRITAEAFAMDDITLAPSTLGFYVGTDEILNTEGETIAITTSAARGDDIDEYQWLTRASRALDVETELFNSAHEIGETIISVSSRTLHSHAESPLTASRLIISTLTLDRRGQPLLATRLDAAGHVFAMTLHPESRRTAPITAERLIRPLLSTD